MSAVKSILVATDFSDVSRHATEYAMGLARQFGAHVTFVHAYEIPAYSFLDGTLIATSELAASISTAADDAMAALVSKQKALGLDVDGIVCVGPPAHEIERVAEQVKADLIVVGTHGRRGLARAFLGSIAEIVVRTATRPVVVVPLPQP